MCCPDVGRSPRLLVYIIDVDLPFPVPHPESFTDTFEGKDIGRGGLEDLKTVDVVCRPNGDETTLVSNVDDIRFEGQYGAARHGAGPFRGEHRLARRYRFLCEEVIYANRRASRRCIRGGSTCRCRRGPELAADHFDEGKLLRDAYCTIGLRDRTRVFRDATLCSWWHLEDVHLPVFIDRDEPLLMSKDGDNRCAVNERPPVRDSPCPYVQLPQVPVLGSTPQIPPFIRWQ